jgi:hypothetical protein
MNCGPILGTIELQKEEYGLLVEKAFFFEVEK